MAEEKDRLKELEENFQRKKHNNTQLYWFKYNPKAEFNFDLEDAREDVEWMIAEIKRLRKENASYREFIDTIRSQMEQELER